MRTPERGKAHLRGDEEKQNIALPDEERGRDTKSGSTAGTSSGF